MMFRCSPFFPLLTALSAFALAASLEALEIRTFNASTDLRFLSFPSSPTINPNFRHASVEMTGVGWDSVSPTRQVTLVSPRHFVGANHFRVPVGRTLSFLANDGSVITRAITATTAIPNSDGDNTDLYIGTLDADVTTDEEVLFLPYLNLPTEASYMNREIIMHGRTVRTGRGVISAFQDFGATPLTAGAGINPTRAFSTSFATTAGNANDAAVENGDSGSPSVVSINGRAAIVGTHTARLSAFGTITSIDTFVPFYIAELNDVMAVQGLHMTEATPSATQLTFATVAPEKVLAGQAFTLNVSVTNAAGALQNPANNLQLSFSESLDGAGTEWVNSGSSQARRGGLAVGDSSDYVSSITRDQPGEFALDLSLRSDESSLQRSSVAVRVVPSFDSFSDGLADPSADADSDGDGLSNLLEFALGSDPVAADAAAFRPVFSDSGVFQFRRSREADLQGLTYVVEVSTDLSQDSWEEVDGGTAVVLDDDFERVDLTLDTSVEERQFIRLRVTLDAQ